MKIKSELVILFLFAIVFFSGCIITTPTTGGNGVVIESFSVLGGNEVQPNTPVTLSLTIRNTASGKAYGIAAELIGVPTDVSITSGATTQYIQDLIGPLTVGGTTTKGDSAQIFWTLVASEKDVDVKYTLSTIVRYNYETQLSAQAKVVTQDYLYRTNEKSEITSQSYNAGPISVKATMPSITSSGGEIPIIFEFNNQGSGSAYTYGAQPTIENLGRMQFTINGAYCPGGNEVRLPKGKGSNTVTCRLNTAGIREKQTYSITLNMMYSYILDSSTTLTVKGKLPI